jgi:hypothetical protein
MVEFLASCYAVT